MTARQRGAHPPVGTLGDCVSKFWIWVHCRNLKCAHSLKHDSADLADKFGYDYPLTELLRRSVCSKCGGKGATMHVQPEYQRDGSDAPRQVQGWGYKYTIQAPAR